MIGLIRYKIGSDEERAGRAVMISREDLGGLVAGYILLAVILVGFGLLAVYGG